MAEKLHPDDGELITEVIKVGDRVVILRMGVVNGELIIEMIDSKDYEDRGEFDAIHTRLDRS